MHASMFHLHQETSASPRERWRKCRSLAAALNNVEGFVAFLALETEDGSTAGLCICVDAPALEAAHQTAEDWQRQHGSSDMRALITGEVIVQQGF